MIPNEEKLAAALEVTTEELRLSMQEIGVALLFDVARRLLESERELEQSDGHVRVRMSDEVPARLLKQAHYMMYQDNLYTTEPETPKKPL